MTRSPCGAVAEAAMTGSIGSGRLRARSEFRRFGVFRGSGLALIRWSAAGSVSCETPSCTAICVRHEALMYRVEVRDLRHRSCRSRSGEAGGSLIREVPVRAGSSPDNDGTRQYCQMAWVRQA